jgi:hypothetical protein
MFFIRLILLGLAGVVVGAAISIVVDTIINKKKVRNAVKDESLHLPKAFKYKILEAKRHAVKVGIFDKCSQQLSTLNIESDEGVADDIQINKWQYL